MNISILAGAILLGLLRPDPAYQKPTPAQPKREACLLTWRHPERGYLAWSIAEIKRSVRNGWEIDRDGQVPWPCVWYWDGWEWQKFTDARVRCIRWTPLRELRKRAKRDANEQRAPLPCFPGEWNLTQER